VSGVLVKTRLSHYVLGFSRFDRVQFNHFDPWSVSFELANAAGLTLKRCASNLPGRRSTAAQMAKIFAWIELGALIAGQKESCPAENRFETAATRQGAG
jgi:hypothetical protein